MDFKHYNGDQPFTNDDYETESGVWPAMLREMESEYEEDLDEETGEVIRYGNRAFAQLERGFDTDNDRELLRAYYQEVGDRYSRAGKIENLEVTVGDPVGLKGVAVRVSGFDVQAGVPQDDTLKAWGNS